MYDRFTFSTFALFHCCGLRFVIVVAILPHTIHQSLIKIKKNISTVDLEQKKKKKTTGTKL